MEQLLTESDEAWALYDPVESRYRWSNASFRQKWGADPSDPWTLFAISPGLYRGAIRKNQEEVTVRILPDQQYYWVHTRERNLALYREAFHHLPVGLVITDVQGALFVDINQTARDFSGYEPGNSTLSLWRDAAQRQHYLHHLQSKGPVRQMPFPFFHLDGRPMDSVTNSALFSHQNQSYLVGTLGSPPPDSGLLHTKTELLQQIFEYAPALIVLSDDSGRIRKVNRSVCALSGYTSDELQDKPFYELIPEEERQKVQQVVELCFHDAHVTYSENHWITKSGERRLLQWSNTRLATGFNNELVHVGIARDITEQRKAEQKFRSLVDNAPDAILEIEANGRVLFTNPAARQIFGNILKTPILNWVHEDAWAEMPDQMQQPQTDVRCRMLHCQDGWRWFDCKGQAGILICRDVTAERQTEESHKMQAVGSVAASLAQEFLQLQKKVEATLEKAARNQAKQEDFQQARQALHEAQELAKQLQNLNQEEAPRPERATLEEMLESAALMLTASLSKVRVQLELQTRESWLSGGRAQLEQMLLNLGLNAVHPGTVLHLSTHKVHERENLDPAHRWVELRIAQNPSGNLYTAAPLEHAVTIPGDPFRVFFPLVT